MDKALLEKEIIICIAFKNIFLLRLRFDPFIIVFFEDKSFLLANNEKLDFRSLKAHEEQLAYRCVRKIS